MGERIRRKVDPNPQGGRSSSQRLSGHLRSERSHRSFYHTGVSPQTPTFGVRGSDTYGISTTNLLLTLRNCGLNKRMHYRSLHTTSNETVTFPFVYGVLSYLLLAAYTDIEHISSYITLTSVFNSAGYVMPST